MIKLLRVISESEYYRRENSYIEDIADHIGEEYPHGVRPSFVYYNYPDVDAGTSLKLMIALAKRGLLRKFFGKISPEDVLKNQANIKDIAKGADFDMNEGINAINTIEDPSYFPGENEKIKQFVDQVEKKRPNGISASEVFDKTPSLPLSVHLKILIALANKRLLDLGGIKVSPKNVLKIYGNDTHKIAHDDINLNEKQYLKGGKGDNLSAKDVDPKELAMGKKVEMEHTKNPRIATEIALDHLAEDPHYYTHLKKAHID